jgi:hypothetical protein
LHPARAAGSPFRKESVLGLPGGVRALLPVQLVGAPGADRPSHGLGRHPGQHQTRTPHNVRSGMAATPRQEKLPGGSLETPPAIKSVGRPPIVTAAGSQRVRRYPGGGSLLSKEAQRTRKLSKRSWTRVTEPEPPNRSEPTRPRQCTRRGRGGGVPGLGVGGVFAVTSLSTAAAAQPEAAEVLGGPPGMHPARIGTGTPPAPTAGPQPAERTDHRRRDGWRPPTVKGSPTRSWWSARQRSSSARWWGARCWSW